MCRCTSLLYRRIQYHCIYVSVASHTGMASAKSSLQRRDQKETAYKDLTSSDGDVQPIPKDLLLDLSFLTDQERRSLIKVIKADQEFRKTTHEALKKSIEQGRQFQELQKSAEGKHEKCTCCGLVLKTICSRTCAVKCSSCQHMVCKRCQKGDGYNSTCILCIKEKLMDLQTLDYMPVISSRKTVVEESPDNSKKQLPHFYGSELLKESLSQDTTTAAATMQKSVRIEEKPNSSKTLPVTTSLATPLQRQKRARSLERNVSTDSPPSTDVNAPDSGFKLIREGRSEESLDDLCSLYSDPGYDCEKISGKIKLGVWYRMDDHTLYVRVAEAKNLINIDDKKPDPYVRMHLLPDKTKQTKRRTSIQRKTVTPEFDELLKYGKLERSDLASRTLWVTVWHWDRHGRNKFLGEVRLPLSTLDLTNTSDVWHNLNEYMDDSDVEDVDAAGSKGKLLLALKYNYHESTKAASLQRNISATIVDVHVLVKKAEGLPAMDPNGSTNAFVRSYLLPNRQVVAKKKTSVIFNSLDPVWEEELLYPVLPLDELETNRVLELTIWDHDRRGINAFIGGLRIGPDPIVAGNPEEWMDATADESSHWEAMLSHPGEWVEQWHELRPSMDPQHLINERRKTTKCEVKVSLSLTSFSSTGLPQPPDGTDPKSSTAPPADQKGKKKTPAPPPSISITRGARGDYKITGEVLVGVEYKDGKLCIRINRAIKLAAVGKGGTSNPYIKIYLLPDSSKKSKLKTTIKRKTVDPVFDETLQYKIAKDQVSSRAMWLTIWSAGRLGNQFLGEACIPLGSLDLTDPGERWYQLHDFVETGVILPANLNTSSSSPTHGQGSRGRINAFSRSTTPASRPESTKSQFDDFVEAGVIPPANLTTSSSFPTHGQGPGRQGSPPHRGRANAFSRSTTPASRPGSRKSSGSGARESNSQSPVPAPPVDTLQLATKPMPRQASTDSDAAHQYLVIPQGEKRGSADSIIPVINIDGESDQELEEK